MSVFDLGGVRFYLATLLSFKTSFKIVSKMTQVLAPWYWHHRIPMLSANKYDYTPTMSHQNASSARHTDHSRPILDGRVRWSRCLPQTDASGRPRTSPATQSISNCTTLPTLPMIEKRSTTNWRWTWAHSTPHPNQQLTIR